MLASPYTTLHCEGDLTHPSFPSILKESIEMSPLSMHREGNITHASFLSIMKEITSALEKIDTLHHNVKLSYVNFP